MTDQPELFSLDPPPPEVLTCPQCGTMAVVTRFGQLVCTECHYGIKESIEAQNAAELRGKARQRGIEKSRRRRR